MPPAPQTPAHNDAGEEITHDSEATGDAQGGLVDAGAARSFNDAVERRLARRAHEDSSPGSSAPGGRPELEEEDNSPVRADSPE